MSEHVVEKDVLAKAENIWNKYQKQILIALGALVVIIGGYYGYQKYVAAPKEQKASEVLYKTQQYFELDSANLVLNGDGASKGALYVIKTYDGTKSANLAKYYAGVSYLRLSDFNNAIKYLKDFSTDAIQIQMKAYTNLAHAYAGANKKEDAITYYKKAGTILEKDEAGSAENLFYAGQLLETLNKSTEALELYKTIKQKYPQTQRGYEIDKYINRISVQKNEFSVN